jgi:phospholipid/cholesterol/gamma-HCH transport system ATP-binding protein
MIQFRSVTYSIGTHRILGDVSFTVPRGETRVILGPSGSGKSTILRLLLGLARPDSGSILVDGVDVTLADEERLRQLRQRIGMVFQQGALFDSMTVGENVGFSLLEHQDGREGEIEESVRAHLTLVGLDPGLIDRMPDQLSGGMQRRVAIARALAARDPHILLYDEPTTGLDPQSAERITDLIVHLRDTMGKTSIMVTHDIADAYKVGNRITLLDEGRIAFEGSASDLDAAGSPFINQFLAPFRKAVTAASQRLTSSTGRTGGALPPAPSSGGSS